MKTKKLIMFILFLLPIMAVAQDTEKVLSKKEIRKKRPVYYDIGVGLNSTRFRDFATSPLFYRGPRRYTSLTRIKTDPQRETSFGLAWSQGYLSAVVGDNHAQSSTKSIFVDYTRLYQVPKWSNDKMNVKVGGKFNHTTNLRINENLGNNAVGIESFTTLFASAKLTKDISRTAVKNKKFLGLIKYTLKPKKRDLSYRLNLGLMNNTHRNGFIYTESSGLLNDENPLDGYKFKIFSGFRIGSSLDSTVYLSNKNAIKLSYEWDAYKTGGDLDKFEMSNHILKFSFLFKAK